MYSYRSGYRWELPVWPHQYRFEAVSRLNGRERDEDSAQRGPAWELKAPIGIEREIAAYCSDSSVKIMEQGTAC
jgi:hypothetical protein